MLSKRVASRTASLSVLGALLRTPTARSACSSSRVRNRESANPSVRFSELGWARAASSLMFSATVAHRLLFSVMQKVIPDTAAVLIPV